MQLTVNNLVREYRNAKRRKGGLARVRFDCVVQFATEAAKRDGYKMNPSDYVSEAEREVDIAAKR